MNIDQYFYNNMKAIPHLPIYYEDDLQSEDRWPATLTRICGYLGISVPRTPLVVKLRKTWSKPYSELISNYAELHELQGA